jgi:hypothetical protein
MATAALIEDAIPERLLGVNREADPAEEVVNLFEGVCVTNNIIAVNGDDIMRSEHRHDSKEDQRFEFKGETIPHRRKLLLE